MKIITSFRHENFRSFSVSEPVKLTGNVKTFLCIDNIYFNYYFYTSDAPASHTRWLLPFCKVSLRKVVKIMWSTMAEKVKIGNDFIDCHKVF